MTVVLFFLSIFIPLALMFSFFYKVFPAISTGTQIFEDFIIDHVAAYGLNKSGELSLFRSTAFVCILLTAVLVFLFFRKKTDILQNSRTGGLAIAAVTAVFPFVGHLVVFGQADTACLLAFPVLLCSYIYKKYTKESPLPFLAVMILSYYAVLAVLTVGVHFSPAFALSQSRIYFISGACSVLAIAYSFYKKFSVKQVLLALQPVISFLPVVFFVDSYVYQGTVIRVPYSLFYYIFFAVLIIFFAVRTFLHARKFWKTASSIPLGRLLHPFTAITVFIYNSYSACPMYAQPDQHHHGEQMIPWQQIVSFGQTAYEDYTPVSGLFPLLNGFIQNVLLGGTVSDYAPAISITMVLFCILTMYLIYKHVGGAYALLFAIFFALPSYNRQYMVLPLLLLLFLKQLLDRPGRWLKFWILGCFLAGLYYPLYGAAVLVGTLPLGIYVFLRYRKETDWKTELKKPLFYVSWFLCLLPILLCLPLLLRMAGHTLVYSGQTILSDGISLYEQSPPDVFLPYLAGTHGYARLWLYYGLRFFLPIIPLMLAIALGTLAFLKSRKDRQQPQSVIFVLGTISVIITLAISYTYTLVRADTGVILSRTAPILIAVAGMFLPVLLMHYGTKLLPSRIRIAVIGICFSFPMLIYTQVSSMKFPDMWGYPNGNASLVMDDADKLFTFYEVPDGFISMSEISLPDTSRLGNGFMVADQVHYLTEYSAVMEKAEAVAGDLTYLGLDGQGFYYYLNKKACATGYIQVAKSYEAQQRILDVVKAQRPVVFLLEPRQSYYIYHWILTEGDYMYSEKDGAFFPREIFEELYPENTAGDDYRSVIAATRMNYYADSFGKSVNTLLPRLEESSVLLEVSAEPLHINGLENDVLYLSLPDSCTDECKTVEITFLSDNTVYEGACVICNTGGGQLLIPMGMNACWLLSDNSGITLTFKDETENTIAVIPLEQAEAVGITYQFYHMKK